MDNLLRLHIVIMYMPFCLILLIKHHGERQNDIYDHYHVILVFVHGVMCYHTCPHLDDQYPIDYSHCSFLNSKLLFLCRSNYIPYLAIA